MTKKPEATSSTAQRELDKAEKQFEAFDQNIKEMTLDRMNQAQKEEKQELRISQKDLEKSKDIYLKPERTIGPGVHPKTGEREKFNEKFRDDYNFSKEYVHFTAYNKEIIGETIELWTKPFAGTNCEFWKVPCGKPIWGPRHLAERLTGCKYHRLTMQQNKTTGSDGMGEYYGSMAVDTTVQRLDAIPMSERKSVFMGANSF